MIFKKILPIALSLGFILSASSCSENKSDTCDFFSMDTYCSVTAYRTDKRQLQNTESIEKVCARASNSAENILKGISGEKTIFAETDGENIEISNELSEILKLSEYVSEISGGSFDLTIAPLSELWDIKNAKTPPSEDKIKEAAALVNYKEISFDNNLLTFSKKGMGIDFGAVGKGFEAGLIQKELENSGYDEGVINLGGNITVFGDKDGQGYRIGIKSPDSGSILGTVNVSDTSVVTSGNYERFFDFEGKRYHHLIDPKTGYPADNRLASVTVICKNHVLADALSTAIYISGLQKGKEIFDELSLSSSSVENKSNSENFYSESGLTSVILVTSNKEVIIWGNSNFRLNDGGYYLQ